MNSKQNLLIKNVILSETGLFKFDAVLRKCLEKDETIKEASVVLVLTNLSERGLVYSRGLGIYQVQRY